jgi:integrase/recombinase XerD
MDQYQQEINLYFELKGTPESSRESYLRRMNGFLQYLQTYNRLAQDINETDIQHIRMRKTKVDNTIQPVPKD